MQENVKSENKCIDEKKEMKIRRSRRIRTKEKEVEKNIENKKERKSKWVKNNKKESFMSLSDFLWIVVSFSKITNTEWNRNKTNRLNKKRGNIININT